MAYGSVRAEGGDDVMRATICVGGLQINGFVFADVARLGTAYSATTTRTAVASARPAAISGTMMPRSA